MKHFLGINWKVRASNPHFWFKIFLSIAVPIGTYFGVTGKDITSWGVLFNLVGQAVSNPYVIAMVVVSVYNSIIDDTSKGLTDSQIARQYKQPNKVKPKSAK
ncbi:phage holin [Mammaliicoccus sciuri]|uniref:phage holin n=1 Tax=Mammaliicoccus sciuri TaxID=1296 RepID=UPI003090CDAA|nr:phage holin [Mammaliicoccus sciuri]